MSATSEADVLLDDVLSALTLVLLFFPVGSAVTAGLRLAYEAIVELRSAQTHMAPENLRAELARRLGTDVADILGDRFGKA